MADNFYEIQIVPRDRDSETEHDPDDDSIVLFYPGEQLCLLLRNKIGQPIKAYISVLGDGTRLVIGLEGHTQGDTPAHKHAIVEISAYDFLRAVGIKELPDGTETQVTAYAGDVLVYMGGYKGGSRETITLERD